jgi:hypothetical protein
VTFADIGLSQVLPQLREGDAPAVTDLVCQIESLMIMAKRETIRLGSHSGPLPEALNGGEPFSFTS